MGVINLTPDSFSDGGAWYDPTRPGQIDRALEQARRLAWEGAEILDLGGESSRPGAAPVDEEEEHRRVLPLLRLLAQEDLAWLSVDTQRAGLAAAALELGVALINDVGAGRRDPDLWPLVAAVGAPTVLMHMQGTPETMQAAPAYHDALAEVAAFLGEKAQALQALGLPAARILLDPGIGFGKGLADNRALLTGLAELAAQARRGGHALLLGASRKSFIGLVEEGEGRRASPPAHRLGGSLAAALWGARLGARVLRVHDVAETRQALQVWRWLEGGGPWT